MPAVRGAGRGRPGGATLTVGRYVNDVTEVGGDIARMIYGDAKYERLVALKLE